MAALFNRVTLIRIVKHRNSIMIFSECVLDLGHPLVWRHAVFFNKDCLAFQMGYIAVMITVDI